MDDRKRRSLEKLLEIAESDLRDCHNPKVLKRWPNLGTPESIAEVEHRVKILKEQLGK